MHHCVVLVLPNIDPICLPCQAILKVVVNVWHLLFKVNFHSLEGTRIQPFLFPSVRFFGDKPQALGYLVSIVQIVRMRRNTWSP